MEFVVQEAAKKVLDCELQRARHLRQRQVRQQSSQWSEERRRRFEQEKIRQKQEMAQQITEQVQEYAQSRIEHLLTAHDLALAEVGAAHRAAAQLRQIEVERRARLEEQKVAAEQRGDAAMKEMLKVQQKKEQTRSESLQRREHIRKEEDRKAKEMLEKSKMKSQIDASGSGPTGGSRQPLLPSNKGNVPGLPSSITTLKEESAGSHLKFPGKVTHTPSKRKFLPTTKSRLKNGHSTSQSSKSGVRSTPSTGAFDRTAKSKYKRHENSPHAKLTSRYTSTTSVTNTTPTKSATTATSGQIKEVPGLQQPTSQTSTTTAPQSGMVSGTGTVRYFDTAIPKPETHYTAPAGLGVREPQNLHDRGSPDAWKKADVMTKLSMQEIEERAKRQEDLIRRADERGKAALKKAQLEKKLIYLKTQLMKGEDAETALGIGRQVSLLDLEELPLQDQFSEMSVSDIESEPDTSPHRTHTTLKKFKVDESAAKSTFGAGGPTNYKALERSEHATKSSVKLRHEKEGSVDNEHLRSEQIAADIIRNIETDISKLKEEVKILSHRRKFGIGDESNGVTGSGIGTRVIDSPLSNKAKTSRPVTPVHDARPGQGNNAQSTYPKSDQFLKMATDSEISSASTADIPRTLPQSNTGVATGEKYTTTFKMDLKSAQQQDVNIKAPDGREHSQQKGTTTDIITHNTKDRRIVVPKKSRSKDKVFKKREDRVIFSPSRSNVIDTSVDADKGTSESTPAASAEKLIIIRSARKDGDHNNHSEFLEMSSINTIASPSNSPNESDVSLVGLKKLKHIKLTGVDKLDEPDGPYTSTPDGKLILTKPSSRSVAVAVSRKDLVLHQIVSGFLTRRVESIELLPVSSSSSSDLKIDSTLITRSPTSTGASNSFYSPFTTPSSAHTSTNNKSTTSPSSGSIYVRRTGTYQNLLKSHTLLTGSQTETDGETSVSLIKASGPSPKDRRNRTEVVSSSAGSGSASGSTLAEATVRTILGSTSASSPSISNNRTTNSANTSNGGHSNKSSKNVETTSSNTGNSTLLNIDVLSQQKIHEIENLMKQKQSAADGSSDPTRDTSYDQEQASMDMSRLSEVITSIRNTSHNSAGTSTATSSNPSPSSKKPQKREVKRAALRNLVGNMSDYTDFISTICPGTAEKQEDIITSIFDQLQEDFVGLMSIEKPPWFV